MIDGVQVVLLDADGEALGGRARQPMAPRSSRRSAARPAPTG